MSTHSEEIEYLTPQRQLRRTLYWLAPVGFLLCLSLVVMLMGSKPTIPAKLGSYDPGAEGARAAFLLLQETGQEVGASKRIIEGKIRWILAPREISRQFEAVPGWVKSGGKLLLADDQMLIADKLGIRVTRQTLEKEEHQQTIRLGNQRITIEAGTVRLKVDASPKGTWPENSAQPLVSIYPLGKGEVWLLHLPELMANEVLKQSMQKQLGNGLVILELGRAMAGASGERIWFDEYFHGMRTQPSIIELLTAPPFVWVTLQGALLLGLALWRHAPRFGTFQEQPVPRRRSKEEYLEALAGMLERKHAYSLALSFVRNSVIQGLAKALSLPAEVKPHTLAQQAVARWPGRFQYDRLTATLSASLPAQIRESDFLRSLHELESIRDVYQPH